ncbi:MAG: hypothetical protein KAS04_07400, partial [Candidatus Aenigmarchaeota archaeon]|nr:hypothetical protein [Candidatus Aenigmarchaeota archaeon]
TTGELRTYGTGAHAADYTYMLYDDATGDGFVFVSGGDLVLGGSGGDVKLYTSMNFVPYTTATASLGSAILGFDGLYLAGNFGAVTPLIYVDDIGTAHSMTVTFTQPTGTRTATFPDLTGTVFLSGTTQVLTTTGTGTFGGNVDAVALTLTANAGQTENMFELKDSGGTLFFWIDSTGSLHIKAGQKIYFDE